jgi:hypothetical protein
VSVPLRYFAVLTSTPTAAEALAPSKRLMTPVIHFDLTRCSTGSIKCLELSHGNYLVRPPWEAASSHGSLDGPCVCWVAARPRVTNDIMDKANTYQPRRTWSGCHGRAYTQLEIGMPWHTKACPTLYCAAVRVGAYHNPLPWPA